MPRERDIEDAIREDFARESADPYDDVEEDDEPEAEDDEDDDDDDTPELPF